MQKYNITKRITTTLILSTIVLFFSCEESSESKISENSKTDLTINENQNYDLQEIDTTAVLAWNELRKNIENVQQCFDNLTNHFSIIRPDESIDSIYVYIGYNKKTKSITLYPISATADSVGNLHCLPTTNINVGDKVDLPKIVPSDTTRADAISLDEAKARVQNWKTDQVRNEWLQNVSSNNDGEYLGLIYIVHTIDMVPGDLHECYLALEEDPSAIGNYSGDLIIVNTSRNEIVQPESKLTTTTQGVIEDVVKLGPPFKGISINNFGLLKRLNIK